MTHVNILLTVLLVNAGRVVASDGYLNVYGDSLQQCSSDGMALTGYTRTGYCVDENDDQGSHHICIDLSSASGGNFCDVTGQNDWCSSEMPCDGDADNYCQVQQWCVCQWAFASYLSNAGGCDYIQTIVCDAINIQALWAYQGNSKYSEALDCLVDRCGLDRSNRYFSLRIGTTKAMWLTTAVALLIVAIGAVVFMRRRSPKKEALLQIAEDDPSGRLGGGTFA